MMSQVPNSLRIIQSTFQGKIQIDQQAQGSSKIESKVSNFFFLGLDLPSHKLDETLNLQDLMSKFDGESQVEDITKIDSDKKIKLAELVKKSHKL